MHKKLGRILLVLALGPFMATFAGTVVGTATVTWVNPTTYTDGTALTLASVNVYRGTSAAGPWTKIGTVTEGSTLITSYTDTSAPAGSTVYYYVTAVDGSGSESAPSNTASKAIALPTPNAPTGLQISNIPGG